MTAHYRHLKNGFYDQIANCVLLIHILRTEVIVPLGQGQRKLHTGVDKPEVVILVH